MKKKKQYIENQELELENFSKKADLREQIKLEAPIIKVKYSLFDEINFKISKKRRRVKGLNYREYEEAWSKNKYLTKVNKKINNAIRAFVCMSVIILLAILTYNSNIKIYVKKLENDKKTIKIQENKKIITNTKIEKELKVERNINFDILILEQKEFTAKETLKKKIEENNELEKNQTEESLKLIKTELAKARNNFKVNSEMNKIKEAYVFHMDKEEKIMSVTYTIESDSSNLTGKDEVISKLGEITDIKLNEEKNKITAQIEKYNGFKLKDAITDFIEEQIQKEKYKNKEELEKEFKFEFLNKIYEETIDKII